MGVREELFVGFGRVLTAMVTPYKDNGEIHYDEAARLASYLVDHGSDGLVVCGTTGESPTLTWEEEFELFQVVRDAVAGKAAVIAGTGSNSTQEAIRATQKAAKLQLQGSLQVVPYYNKPSQAGLYQHFKMIAETSDMPIMLYNVPGRTGVSLQPETIARLAELPAIVAIKEASGSMDIVSAIRRSLPEPFAIYAGDDSLTLPMLALGATGVVSVASHLVGSQLQQMILAFEKGQPRESLAIHQFLFPLFRALFIDTNPVPIKAALALTDWQMGSVRPPLSPLSEHLTEQLREVMEELGLLASSRVTSEQTMMISFEA
ncbi:MAG: 4-hydroxy-tetrahydrodipicolinate synthase [Synechococcaceae cyanobacterium SM2_3_1]|nr:4-hydroxy-tetrahydrodipicolinate synthase [Synechococcaceae cyanobacterium SM2_3_1]